MRRIRYLVGGSVAVLSVCMLWTAGPALAAQTQTAKLSVKPRLLPKKRRAPVRAGVTTATTDPAAPNQVPSPAISAKLDLDNAFLFTPGVAARCPATAVANKSTADAKAACPKAIVGGGSAEVFVPTGPTTHVVFNAEVTAFNGQPQSGHPTIILHNYVGDLALGQDLFAVIRKSRAGRDYGPRLDVSIPALPLGAALTRFSVNIGNGFKRGYIKANCSDRNRKLNLKAAFRYQNGTGLTARGVARCRRRG
jgi:hypothetical protein